MSRKSNKQSDEKENRQPKTGVNTGISLEGLADPVDLVYGTALQGNPEEILTNPAVTPQMPDETRPLRDDLRKDENTMG